MIEYKGYTGVVEFDPSIDAFHGRVVGLQDVVTFEGRSLDELRREMAEAAGMSLNAWVEAAISSVVREKGPSYGEPPPAKKRRGSRKREARTG